MARTTCEAHLGESSRIYTELLRRRQASTLACQSKNVLLTSECSLHMLLCVTSDNWYTLGTALSKVYSDTSHFTQWDLLSGKCSYDLLGSFTALPKEYFLLLSLGLLLSCFSSLSLTARLSSSSGIWRQCLGLLTHAFIAFSVGNIVFQTCWCLSHLRILLSLINILYYTCHFWLLIIAR